MVIRTALSCQPVLTKLKIFFYLTLEKASQPSSAITLPQQTMAGLLLLAAQLCASGRSSSEAGGQLLVTRWAPESL